MDELIYLDNAATSWPKPDKVYEYMVDVYRRCGVNPGRSGFDKAIEAGNIVEGLRQRLTRFFGGDEVAPERLCFSYNATDALNEALAKLDLDKAEVVTIYYGADTELAEAERVSASIREQHPQLQVEVVQGGQPHYNYIISIE